MLRLKSSNVHKPRIILKDIYRRRVIPVDVHGLSLALMTSID